MLLFLFVNFFFGFVCFGMIVIEAHGKQGGVPKVVERWGEPDSSKCVLAASINDCKIDPVSIWYYELF